MGTGITMARFSMTTAPKAARLLLTLALLAVTGPLADAAPGADSTPRVRNPALAAALPLLREGDLIFIRPFINPMLRLVARTTNSWESHVGILFRDARGGWTVAEGAVPLSKFTPVTAFVARSEKDRFEVRRVKATLKPDAVARLRAAAEQRMGVFFDTGYNYDSTRTFCAKLVYDCYREATGIAIGRIVTFRDIAEANPDAPMGFWRTWFAGRIPWERRVVTTTSQIRSPALVPVFDSTKFAPASGQ